MTEAVIPIIDVDTHIIEPADLWTSRLPSKWADDIPRVKWYAEGGFEAWYIGDQRLPAAAAAAMAGWNGYPPDHPASLADVDPALYDPKSRVRMMDEYGIQAQLLYPNISLFNSERILNVKDRELQIDISKAYNDWQTEWSSEAPDRLIPIASVPFWNLDATIEEMIRCKEMGHRGIIFTQQPSYFGLPHLDDPHWDPMWSTAQELQLPINFHIGTGDVSLLSDMGFEGSGEHALFAGATVVFSQSNARTIAQLITGGVCHRFPGLNFVSVESGIGWIPYVLEYLDWQWKNCGVSREHPEYDLLPSEYFKRQIYGCFWFEQASALFAIEALGDNNVLYETDFPHPTSMSPGPASVAVHPREYVASTLGSLSPSTLNKILHDNAARIYGLS